MVLEKSELDIINVNNWLKENENNFLPPVCNKLMHNSQLIIMFVGGPNTREDYHIQEGEELFYQIKGDACIKILENNVHTDIIIKEGEFFLLPARIPHSPQRTANSLGLVVERRRNLNETDSVRWFVPGTTDILFDRWFYCKDLGIELVPLIKEFFASEEFKTKVPGSNISDVSKAPFKLNNVLTIKEKHGSYNLLNQIAKSSGNEIPLCLSELNLQFEVSVLKSGHHVFNNLKEIDFWLWQLKGSSEISIDNSKYNMKENDSILIPEKHCENIIVDINSQEGLIIKISQDPKLKH